MNCKLLDSVIIKGFGESKKEYENRMKEYFEKNIKNNNLTFENKKIKVLYSDDEDKERSWRKFIIGSEKAHNNTTKYDYRRIPFLPLIPIILSDQNKCSECECYSIERLSDKIKIIVKCENYFYKIILSYNEQEDLYYLLSGYRTK